jgi:hypothetical protein
MPKAQLEIQKILLGKVKMFEYAAVKFRDTIFGPDNEYVSLSNIKLGLIWSARQLPLLDAAAQSD